MHVKFFLHVSHISSENKPYGKCDQVLRLQFTNRKKKSLRYILTIYILLNASDSVLIYFDVFRKKKFTLISTKRN